MIPWDQIVDTTAIAIELGVQPDTVHTWRQRELGCPPPRLTLAIGPIWLWADWELWAEATGRLP